MDTIDHLIELLENQKCNLEVVYDKEPDDECEDDLPRPCRSGPRVAKLSRHGIPWFTSGFT